MATTIITRSEPYFLINSSTALTVGSIVSVTDGGTTYNCTVIKIHVGTRNYVVKKP